MTAQTIFSGLGRAGGQGRRWALVGIVILIGAGLFVSRALEIRHLQQELVRLEAEKAKIHKEIEQLSVRLKERDNLKLIEIVARRELGMVKPGEEIYIFIEDGETER